MTNKTKKITPYLRLGISFLLCVGMGLGLMLFMIETKADDSILVAGLFGAACVFLARRVVVFQKNTFAFSLIWMSVCMIFACIIALFYESYAINSVIYLLIGGIVVGVTALDSFLLTPLFSKKEPSQKGKRLIWTAIGAGSILLLHGTLFILFYFDIMTDYLLISFSLVCFWLSLYLVAYDWLRKYSPYPYMMWAVTILSNAPFWIMIIWYGSWGYLLLELLLSYLLDFMLVIDLVYLAVHFIKKRKEKKKLYIEATTD